MLNIIAITSSNTSKPQADMQLNNNQYTTTNPRNDDSLGKHQKFENTINIENTGNHKYLKENTLPPVHIHNENDYICELWKPLNETNEKPIPAHALLSYIDNMIMETIPVHQIYGSQMIWEIIGAEDFEYLEILNTVPNKLMQKVFVWRDIHAVSSSNKQAYDIQSGGFMFFSNINFKEKLFCAQFSLNDKGVRVYQTVNIEGIKTILFILETTNVVYYLSTTKNFNHHELFTIQEASESNGSAVGDESKRKYETEEIDVRNSLRKETSFNNDEKEDTTEQDSILNKHNMNPYVNECSMTSNTKVDMNITPGLNITKDCAEKISVHQLHESSNEEKAVSYHQRDGMAETESTGDHISEVQPSHKIGVDQVESLNIDKHISDDIKVHFFDPISNLESKNEIVLSEDDNIDVSITFLKENVTFKRVRLIENQSFFNNQTDLHFIPFYFYHKQGDDIKVKRTIIFIYTGDSDILYCQAFDVDISLNELEGLRKTDTKAFISKISEGTIIRSLREIVSILKTNFLFNKLQDRSNYAQVSYKPQTTSLKDTILNCFKRFWKWIRRILGMPL